MLLSCLDVGLISAGGAAHGGAASGVPAPSTTDPFPNAFPPPRMPELPASQWQSFSPTTTMKALCRALIETCKFAGESLHCPQFITDLLLAWHICMGTTIVGTSRC